MCRRGESLCQCVTRLLTFPKPPHSSVRAGANTATTTTIIITITTTQIFMAFHSLGAAQPKHQGTNEDSRAAQGISAAGVLRWEE